MVRNVRTADQFFTNLDEYVKDHNLSQQFGFFDLLDGHEVNTTITPTCERWFTFSYKPLTIIPGTDEIDPASHTLLINVKENMNTWDDNNAPSLYSDISFKACIVP